MSQYALRLPDSLFLQAKRMAKKDGASLNQLFITAIAEKISALNTADLLQERGKRANKKQYMMILKKVSARNIIPGDEII